MPIAHQVGIAFRAGVHYIFAIDLTNATDSDHKSGTQDMLGTRTVRIHRKKEGGSTLENHRLLPLGHRDNSFRLDRLNATEWPHKSHTA